MWMWQGREEGYIRGLIHIFHFLVKNDVQDMLSFEGCLVLYGKRLSGLPSVVVIPCSVRALEQGGFATCIYCIAHQHHV